MSIPFYFAAEENEANGSAGKRFAQLGFGFDADGALRLPAQRIPDAPAVIDDRFLPEKAPASAILDALAETCGNGCFLDFERPINEVSAAIAVGLWQRLRGNMTVPPAMHGLCPDADVQIPGLLCNNWERFLQNAHAAYGNHWVLEIVPWRVSIPTLQKKPEEGYLQTALCRYRAENGSVLYFDTEESVKQKLNAAEAYGCAGAITLLREYRML